MKKPSKFKLGDRVVIHGIPDEKHPYGRYHNMVGIINNVHDYPNSCGEQEYSISMPGKYVMWFPIFAESRLSAITEDALTESAMSVINDVTYLHGNVCEEIGEYVRQDMIETGTVYDADYYADEYVWEGARSNGLPAWRGPIIDYTTVPSSRLIDYSDVTIPPKTMLEHILARHCLRERIYSVALKNYHARKLLMAKYNTSDVKVYKRMIENLQDKYKSALKGTSTLSDFDKEVLAIINIEDEKDHYPWYMTDSAIMNAIRDAYRSAKKIDARKTQMKENKNVSQEELIYYVENGVQLYEGVSVEGLVIQFYFNFDSAQIETAYPILKYPSNNKKHQKKRD